MTKKSSMSSLGLLLFVLLLGLGCAETTIDLEQPVNNPIKEEVSFEQIRSLWPSTLCTNDNGVSICHEHPKIGAVSIYGVAMVSPNFQWLVGEQGVIWHFNGQDFKLAYSQTGLILKGIYAFNENYAIAVGYEGTYDTSKQGVILEWNGKNWKGYEGPCVTDPVRYCSWSELKNQFTGTWLFSITGTPQGDFWIVGALPDNSQQPNIPLLLEKKGTGPLRRFELPKWYGALNSIHAIDKNNIWAVGNRGTVIHSENNGWQYYDTGINRDFYGVHANSNGSVWVVGQSDLRAVEKSIIMKYNGLSWTKILPAKAWDLRAVWGSSDTDMWIAGAFGVMLHYDGVSFTVPDLGGQYSINQIRGAASLNEITAVGDDGVVFRWDGKRFISLTSLSQERVQKIWALPQNEYWAVGRGGSILKKETGRWSNSFSKTSQSLNDIWASGPGDLWAVGGSGTVLHGNGYSWSQVSVPVSETLTAIWGSPSQDVYVVGNNGIILRGDTSGLWVAYNDKKTMFTSVWGSSTTDVWFGGDSGTLIHWDGIKFSSQTVGPSDSLILGIFGTSNGDLWIINSAGQVLQKNLTGWQKIYENSSAKFFGITGSSPQDLFLINMDGTLLHYDGGSWEKIVLGQDRLLLTFLSLAEKELMIGGSGGALLRIKL